MEKDIPLPFGQTSVTLKTVKETTDASKASKILRKRGVDDPERRINSFLDQIPALLEWLEENGREYPWRFTTDPWKVYVAEILLQRTRADVVAEKYTEFLERYPSPSSLAQAEQSDILNLVKGLGFEVQRVRTLKSVGKIFTEEHNGKVPEELKDLKEPWRVGEYCARACHIFAKGESLGLVDANIARVVGRIFGLDMPSQPHKSDEIYAIMDSLVPGELGVARAFNLGIIDLGALVCSPSNPDCDSCPLVDGCGYWK